MRARSSICARDSSLYFESFKVPAKANTNRASRYSHPEILVKSPLPATAFRLTECRPDRRDNLYAKYFTDLNALLYVLVGIGVCVGVGMLSSVILPQPNSASKG